MDIRADIDRWLDEDLGIGDATAHAVVPPAQAVSARLVAKQDGVLAGIHAFEQVFAQVAARGVGPEIRIERRREEGEPFARGDVLAELSGAAHTILAGERVALNLLGHLTGIATLTARYVAALGDQHATLLDTRKTLPGLRRLAKAAVLAGGGSNHRMRLDDAILIKENHLIAVGGKRGARLAEVVRSAVARAEGLPVEVEVESMAEMEAAIEGGCQTVMLDNMPPAELRRCVARARELSPTVQLEASGGITEATIAEVAATGVDRISVGALTHSAPCADLSLRFVDESRYVDGTVGA